MRKKVSARGVGMTCEEIRSSIHEGLIAPW